MFRWNGTIFQLDVSEYTLPKDSASGSRIPSENGSTHAVLFFQVAKNSSLTYCVNRADYWNGNKFNIGISMERVLGNEVADTGVSMMGGAAVVH